MKSVLISIKPKDCKLIANGKMTIKVLKSRPKIETPVKCYIYRTTEKVVEIVEEYDSNFKLLRRKKTLKKFSGKVIGEFICNKVEKLEEHIEEGGLYYTLKYDFNEAAQLDNWQLHDYGKGKTLYGWHISSLKIYDQPKELSEFVRHCRKDEPCIFCEHLKEYGCENWTFERLTRPPQSWCYVEVEE